MSRAPRSRIPWLRIALVIPGMAIAAGVIADPVSITAALQGWVLAAIALAIAALALVAARRALRAKKESAAGATRLLDLASTRFDSDGSAHQRVRLALLAVFVTGGAHVLLQAWLDERAESSRSWDSEVMDVAGSQRWHSQRIGRLAIASATASADPVAVAGELRSALDRAKRDAQRLEQLLNALPAAPLQNHGALQDAIRGWQQTRQRLWTHGEALLAAMEQTDPFFLRALARQAEAEADPALEAAQTLVSELMLAARERHARDAGTARLWYWLSLALVVTFAWFVVEPAARSVKRQHRRIIEQARQLERLALVAERTTNMVIITDAQRNIVWVNNAFTAITGYVSEQAIGATPAALLLCDRADAGTVESIRAALQQGVGARAQILGHTRDGSDLWLDLDVQPVRTTDGRLAGFVDVAVDITERRRNQAELRVAAIAFDALDAIVITDSAQRILRVNHAFTRITGYTQQEAAGQTTGRLLRSGRHDDAFYAEMREALERHQHWQGEIWNRRKSGEIYPEWLSITAVTDDGGETTNYVAMFTDITQKKQADELIHNLAFYDPLTELPNRRLLLDRLQQTLAGCARHRRSAAVLFMDLDHFKELNDTKGHDVGDLLLVQVARRLRRCVRGNDTVARHGGDEFVVVLEDLSADPEEAATQAGNLAEKMRETICRPFTLGGHEHHCTTSIGISMLAGETLSVDELLKRADTAMYQAKRSGRNAIRYFDPQTHAAMQARVALEADLRKALPAGQFRLHYQRQVDLWGNTIGAEVLLRWSHPQRGDVPPAQFIAAAEESELIVEIGQWVLEAACRQLKAWEGDARLREIKLAVNVSARQFRDVDFAARVCRVLAHSAVDPSRLKLELTESLVLVNVVEAASKMQALRNLGVGFAIDDFGTGQSSLAYLSRLPLDQLKIDQSFVRNAEDSPTDGVIVQTIIGMARNLGLDVIAEGVETDVQRDFLVRSGCKSFQGYLYGRPMPLEQFEREALPRIEA